MNTQSRSGRPRRTLLALGLLLLGMAQLASPLRAQAGGGEAGPAVEAYLRAQMELNRIPAVSVAIVRDGRTELLAAFGTANLEWDAPATTATAYQLASATKPLTGTALMLLVQAGALALDESVRTYLPEAPAAWQPITLRHLATHASGISDDLGDAANGSAGEAVQRLMAQPLVFEPGSRSAYGIGGYAVLQHVLERTAGMPFDTLLRTQLLEPLVMTQTRFDHSADHGPFRDADVVPQRAGIYVAGPDGEQRITWFHYGAAALTAGGLLASAEDLAKWAAALDGEELLHAPHREDMWQEGNGAADGYGIGWALGRYRGRRTAGHSGGPALADILRFPDEKLTIIVLANQSRMYPYLAQGVADLVVPAPVPVTPAPLADNAPEVTGRIRALLDALADGDLPDEFFTAEARNGLVPQVRTFLPPYTRSLGTPTAVTLAEEQRGKEGWTRAYHVSYAGKPVLWRFELAPDGRIRSLRPFPQ